MAKRLDVTTLIEIMGKEKVRAELDKNIWNYTIIETTQYIHFIPKIISKRIEVPKGVKPIEYMFFNDSDFLRLIIMNMYEDWTDLDDEILAFIKEAAKELVTEKIEFLWQQLLDDTLDLPVSSFNSLFLNSIGNGIYALLYDANMNIVFPTSDGQSTSLAKKFMGVEEAI